MREIMWAGKAPKVGMPRKELALVVKETLCYANADTPSASTSLSSAKGSPNASDTPR
jgi:hypothetical protein